MPALLALDGLGKRYGAVRAVEGVSLAFAPGTIHAVVGENGAGKSTLLRMAAGVVTPDAGVVRVDGEALVPHTAAEAIRRGVGMVQQHFALVGILSAIENVMLGAEAVKPSDGSTCRARGARAARRRRGRWRCPRRFSSDESVEGLRVRAPAAAGDRAHAGARGAGRHRRRADRGADPGESDQLRRRLRRLAERRPRGGGGHPPPRRSA